MLNDLTPQSVYDTVGWAIYAFYNKKNDLKKIKYFFQVQALLSY